MKTKKLLPAILLLFLSLFVLQGSALFNRDIDITICDEDATILQKTYKLEANTLIKVKLLYRGDYKKVYHKAIENGENPLKKLSADLANDIEKLPNICDKQPIDAQVFYQGKGKFLYQKEESGYKVDTQKTVERIFDALNQGGCVQLPKEDIKPKVTQKHLQLATQKIAEFSTSCAGSSAERKHNIGLACQFINNSQVPPDAQFSFNEVVGERTEKRGFQTAKIIVSGEFVEGVGGGVCQVSSTLYNAWCLAGLKVVRSATHSLPVHYVSPGLDAMVASSSDLVLQNDSDNTIYIDASCVGDTVKFVLYGMPCGMVVKLRSEVLKVLSGTEYTVEKMEITDWKETELFRIIKKPKDGLISASYREFYDNDGTLIFQERLRKTVYLAQKGKIVYKFSTDSNAS